MHVCKLVCLLLSLHSILQVCVAQTDTTERFYVVKKVGDDRIKLDASFQADRLHYAQWQKDNENVYLAADVADGGFQGEYDNEDKYEIERTDTHVDLVIKNIQLADGGLYQINCLTEIIQYYLVVVDDVRCTPETEAWVNENEEITYRCSARTAGAADNGEVEVTPELGWYSGNSQSVQGQESEDVQSDYVNMMNDYVGQADNSHDGTRFYCRLTVTGSGNGITRYGDVVQDSCHTVYHVNKPVRDLMFFYYENDNENDTMSFVDRETYNIGDTLVARVDGSLNNLVITWICNNEPAGEGHQLRLDRGHKAGEGLTECYVEAENSLNNVPYAETIYFQINIPNDRSPEQKTGGTNTGGIVAAVLIPLLIIAIVCVIGGWFIMKKRRERKAAQANGTAAVPEKTPYENKNFQGSEPDVKNQPSNAQLESKPMPPQRGIAPNSHPYGGNTQQGYPGRGSPGYADLGVKHLSGSVPGLNESIESLPDPSRGTPISGDPRGGYSYKPEPPLRYENKGGDTQV